MVLTQGDPVTPCEAYIPLYLESYIIYLFIALIAEGCQE